jgi:hypothetical protein
VNLLRRTARAKGFTLTQARAGFVAVRLGHMHVATWHPSTGRTQWWGWPAFRGPMCATMDDFAVWLRETYEARGMGY